MGSQAAAKDRTARLRNDLGQFLTPRPVPDLMASMFDLEMRDVDLLDAGAGAGALTAAFVRRLCAEDKKPRRISVTAYEVDPNLIERLQETLWDSQQEAERCGISFSASVFNEDFISAVAPSVRRDLFSTQPPSFNMAIVNPPYRKIHSYRPASMRSTPYCFRKRTTMGGLSRLERNTPRRIDSLGPSEDFLQTHL